MSSLVDQHESIRRRLDGILRTYIRQPHKGVGITSVRGQVEATLRDGLSIEEAQGLLMLIETDNVQSKKRFDEIRDLLASYMAESKG